MADPLRAAELYARTLLADQRQPVVFKPQLLRQSLDHVRRLCDLISEKDAGEIAVKDRRRIGLQINALRLCSQRWY